MDDSGNLRTLNRGEMMELDDDGQEVKWRIIRIKLSDGSKINGRVNIKRNQRFDRLSDLVSSREEQFLVITDAVIYEAELENPVKFKTIFVNKTNIVWAAPDDAQR